MKPSWGFFLLALSMVAGCALFVVSPPAPPDALSLPDAPTDYQLTPFKWASGTILTYNIHQFTEEEVGDQRLPDERRATFRMRGLERTATGGVRVGLTVDSTDLGSFRVDDAGVITDAMAADPAVEQGFSVMMNRLQISQSAQLKSKRLRKGESFTIEVPVPSGWPSVFPQGRPGIVKETMTFYGQFLGYVTLGERSAVGIRYDVQNILQRPVSGDWWGSSKPLRVNFVGGYIIQYLDPAKGFAISNFSELITEGRLGDQPYFSRKITTEELDRTRSSGL